MPPVNMLNVPTRLMKSLGYGRAYACDDDTEEDFSSANYFPNGMDRLRLTRPTERGAEVRVARVARHLERLEAVRDTLGGGER